MSSHKKIVLESEPKGKFGEGVITGTPKPGTMLQMDVSEAKVGGRHTWEVYAPGTDGNRRPVVILLEDGYQGKTITEAYVSGDRCFWYIPQPGDELQVLVANIAGTGDAFTQGDLLIADNSTGKFIATTGSPESEPFMCMESVSALTADTLIHVMYTGY